MDGTEITYYAHGNRWNPDWLVRRTRSGGTGVLDEKLTAGGVPAWMRTTRWSSVSDLAAGTVPGLYEIPADEAGKIAARIFRAASEEA